MLLLLISKCSNCSLQCSTVIELVSLRIASIQLDHTDSGGSRPSVKEGGGGHPDPEIKGERSQKNVFLAPRASVWSKTKGGGGEGRAPPLDPPLTDVYLFKMNITRVFRLV